MAHMAIEVFTLALMLSPVLASTTTRAGMRVIVTASPLEPCSCSTLCWTASCGVSRRGSHLVLSSFLLRNVTVTAVVAGAGVDVLVDLADDLGVRAEDAVAKDVHQRLGRADRGRGGVDLRLRDLEALAVVRPVEHGRDVDVAVELAVGNVRALGDIAGLAVRKLDVEVRALA